MSFRTQLLDDHQIIVSVELLKFLQWLIEHEQEVLKRLIKKALDQNVLNEMRAVPASHNHIKNEIGNVFMILETLLHEISDTSTQQLDIEKLQPLLMPFLDHIDTTQCTQETITKSIQKAIASTKKNDHQSENPQKTLYREFLKYWQPPKSVN